MAKISKVENKILNKKKIIINIARTYLIIIMINLGISICIFTINSIIIERIVVNIVNTII